MFEVINPGLFTTIQDLGRNGYQSSGFSPAGAMDFLSAMIANQLVDNAISEAVLEFTLQGATLKVLEDCVIATAGADMAFTINQKEMPVGQTLSVYRGDTLTFGQTRKGMRTYFSVRGGINVLPILGSRSTHTRSGIGGLNGAALKVRDVIKVGSPKQNYSFKQMINNVEEVDEQTIHAIPGPQYDLFTEEAKRTFFQESYFLTNESDRMGFRLDGPYLETVTGSHDIISEPTYLGDVQVPKSGLPIILLNDRQTAGGYTRIATVVQADLPKLVQVRPGSKIRFVESTVGEAAARFQQLLKQIKSGEFIETLTDFSHYRRYPAEKIQKLLLH